jgi:hypothetical protein
VNSEVGGPRASWGEGYTREMIFNCSKNGWQKDRTPSCAGSVAVIIEKALADMESD